MKKFLIFSLSLVSLLSIAEVTYDVGTNIWGVVVTNAIHDDTANYVRLGNLTSASSYVVTNLNFTLDKSGSTPSFIVDDKSYPLTGSGGGEVPGMNGTITIDEDKVIIKVHEFEIATISSNVVTVGIFGRFIFEDNGNVRIEQLY